MNIKKFRAPDMKQALALIKTELGPDAMVVATREVKTGRRVTGVEVTAAVDTSGEAKAASGPSPRLVARDAERLVEPLRSELRSLKAILRSQTSARQTTELRSELSALRELVAGIGAGRASSPSQHSLADLAASHTLAAPSEGRVLALVGPTGVGKTTTIAKLAGAEALIEGKRVALITLDAYRIGGLEQMRVFADLIGVPLHIAQDASQLAGAIAQCSDCDRIYIDTAGRSPRDTAALAMLEDTLRGTGGAEVHLAMSCGADPRTVDATFRHFDRLGIDRLLFTKLDEAADLSELVRAPARLGTPISFMTTGQRIPEDLELATQAGVVGWATRGFAAEAA